MNVSTTKTPPANARAQAVRALEWIFSKKRPLDHFYDQDPGFGSLSPRDQALIKAIIGSCLRHMGQIDAVLSGLLQRPLPKNAHTARQILRAGIAELLFLRSAPHGVVHTLVQLAGKKRTSRHYKSLINAIFRRVVRDGDALLAKTDPASNIPTNIFDRWEQNWGEGTGAAAAQTLAEPPPLDLTWLRPDPDLADQLGGVALGTQTTRLVSRGRVEDLPGYEAGNWVVQDVSAALPVQILDPQPREFIADLCAAPGGKTMQLAAAGANVTALDRNPDRLKRVKENLTRTKLKAKLICQDAREWEPEKPFDAVLLDAPCSATGIFRHQPDVLFNRRDLDFVPLQEQQLALAIKAEQILKPGGRLVYCVCSAEPEEGEELVAQILSRTELVLDPIQSLPFEASDGLLQKGMVRIAPGSQLFPGGMDGFFIARFQKP
jgi:16S rRNA (cytosine967-C5)-methyltransferase